MLKVINRNPMSQKLFVTIIIFFFALLLRLPYLSYPEKTVGDEVIYDAFALNILYEIPFFEIHPPLPGLIFATIIAPSHPSLQEALWGVDKPFFDFPYQKIRLFNAVLGSFLPVIIFLIALLLGFPLGASLVPATLVVIEGMFVQYSRLVLPDMLLWVAGFLGILFLLFGMRCQKTTQKWFFVLSAGILFGLATSVKWTALGFLLTAGYLLLSKKALRFFAPMALLALVAYISVFSVFVFATKGGPIESERSYYPKYDYIQKLSFPKDKTPSNITRFFIEYHRAAFRINRDPRFIKEVTFRGKPYQWPLALAPFALWENGAGSQIIVSGNLASWRVVFLVVLVGVFIVLRGIFTTGKKLEEHESFLLAGYLLNYIPFFFVMFSRPMYLYHYGVSLIFAFLLIPAIFARAKNRFSHSNAFWGISYTLVVLIAVTALLLSPFTYGF